MDENLDSGVKINLISSRKLDSMTSPEKLRFILDQVKTGTVLVLERGLTAVEEIDLIKATMGEINHDTFIGIEMQSYSAEDLKSGNWLTRLLGRTRVPKMSVIGPASLLKTIHKDGNIIQTMILTGKSVAQEISDEELGETTTVEGELPPDLQPPPEEGVEPMGVDEGTEPPFGDEEPTEQEQPPEELEEGLATDQVPKESTSESIETYLGAEQPIEPVESPPEPDMSGASEVPPEAPPEVPPEAPPMAQEVPNDAAPPAQEVGEEQRGSEVQFIHNAQTSESTGSTESTPPPEDGQVQPGEPEPDKSEDKSTDETKGEGGNEVSEPPSENEEKQGVSFLYKRLKEGDE
jgi:hypothetical protein